MRFTGVVHLGTYIALHTYLKVNSTIARLISPQGEIRASVGCDFAGRVQAYIRVKKPRDQMTDEERENDKEDKPRGRDRCAASRFLAVAP